jgi:hypothetical protein
MLITIMSENTKIGNNEYNLLKAIGREADFLHETIDEYKIEMI